MPTKLISFGFKHGQPTGDNILVLDIRKEPIPNPHHTPSLKNLKGTDPRVRKFLDTNPKTPAVLSTLRYILKSTTKDFVYIGCTGGHHRSVYLVERLGKEMGLEIAHRDITKQ